MERKISGVVNFVVPKNIMLSNRAHTTADGSSTLLSGRFGGYYHSQYGALTESQHIFIGAGLKPIGCNNVSILEVGLGTGLNAALTAAYAGDNNLKIRYEALELYPLEPKDLELLNFDELLPPNAAQLWSSICKCPWEIPNTIAPFFTLTKRHTDFTQWVPQTGFDLIYFDAFAPENQPEMWQREQFQKLFDALAVGGLLVTFCVKGEVKRTLREIGFKIERLEGPPGKKHILRATKK